MTALERQSDTRRGVTRKAYVSHDSKALRTWVQFPPPPPSFVALKRFPRWELNAQRWPHTGHKRVPKGTLLSAAGQRSNPAEGRLALFCYGFRCTVVVSAVGIERGSLAPTRAEAGCPKRAQQTAKHPWPSLAITNQNSGSDERQTVLRTQKPPRSAHYG